MTSGTVPLHKPNSDCACVYCHRPYAGFGLDQREMGLNFNFTAYPVRGARLFLVAANS